MKTKLIVLVIGIVASGCAASQASKQSPTPRQAGATSEHSLAAHIDMCADGSNGTTVTAHDTDRAVALEFKTTGDVAELRQKVRRMATMRNRHLEQMDHQEDAMMQDHHEDSMSGGHHGSGMMHGNGSHMMADRHEAMTHDPPRGMMPGARASTDDVELGARLVFTPLDPGDLPDLTKQVRQHAVILAAAECAPTKEPQGGQAEPRRRRWPTSYSTSFPIFTLP